MDNSKALGFVLILVVPVAVASLANRTDDLLDVFLLYDDGNGNASPDRDSCSHRLRSSLEKLRRRQAPVTASGYIDLSGYALHQTLRRAPLDMYVTDIKVRTPGIGNWVRVERCRYLSRENRLAARLLFSDLAVTGKVKLFDESPFKDGPERSPRELCSMTVRLRSAGLGLAAFPTRGRSNGIDVRTEARFVDPNYLSVHAYGCKVHGGWRRNGGEEEEEEEERPVRIIAVDGAERGDDDPHKERVLAGRFHTERDRLKAVLRVKNLIAQQANQVFQTHGPFSGFHGGGGHTPANPRPASVVSAITELDEDLAPLRPVPVPPLHAEAADEELSREMEDTFLRGIKALLTKYMEKQLEVPLKEALMVSIGYTVSYG